jgi:hypothetical protein
MEELINWVKLSRYLAGNESSVSRTRCPKKYQGNVDSLIVSLKAWEEKIKEKDLKDEPSSNDGL